MPSIVNIENFLGNVKVFLEFLFFFTVFWGKMGFRAIFAGNFQKHSLKISIFKEAEKPLFSRR